jgi:hypothetical protein
MERFKGACTDWTSYAEINRPNCLILGRFAGKQGANRFGRLILANRKLSRGPVPVFRLDRHPGTKKRRSPTGHPSRRQHMIVGKQETMRLLPQNHLHTNNTRLGL